MFSLKNIIQSVALVVAMAASIGSASASVATGNYNAAGYAVIGLNVDSTSNVDLAFISGYSDPTFSLFDGTGLHLISNDDSNGLRSHITRNLAAGHYSLLVSYCCSFASAVPGSTFASNDGFNSGSYWIGGSATLAGMSSFLDANAYGGGANALYNIAITNAVEGNNVPEPASMALFGIAAAGVLAARRRKQNRA